jgi:hypothetical protein
MTMLADKRISTHRDVNLNSVRPGSFQTVSIKIIAWRNFDERDRAPGKPGWRSATVNEAFARRYPGGRNPLGCESMRVPDLTSSQTSKSSASCLIFSYRGLREESEQAYFPFFEEDGGTFYINVRGTRGTPYARDRDQVEAWRQALVCDLAGCFAMRWR